MPQLSAAELAWAVDTQELYIGNGSIAEGAPYVGNTRILTEHDNLFELTSGYRFANDDVTITASVTRSLQSKLDEVQVSLLDFGPIPDPSTDHAVYFTTAFRQLFQNADTNYRKVLIIPNGYYVMKSVLRIPSNVVLQGETRDGVVIDVNTNGIEFLSANNTTEFDFTSTDRPENIRISNLTISYTTGETNLTGLKDSYFDNVKWVAEYVFGDTVSTPVLASQTYELSNIVEGGDIKVTDGTNNGLTASFIQSLFLTGSNTVSVIDDLVEQLMADTTFDNNFVASRSAESLVITLKSDSQIEMTADEIADYFVVQIKSTSTSSYVIVDNDNGTSRIATPASTGIENTIAAVKWDNSASFGTRVNNIHFNNCTFDSVNLGIKCLQTASYETVLFFDRCEFYNCDTGIYIQGASDAQINNWKLDDCKFESIAKQAVFSKIGYGTIIHRARFTDCGNDVTGPTAPSYPIVEFGTKNGNVLVDCVSDRHQLAGITLDTTKVGMPEAKYAGSAEFDNDNFATIYRSDTAYPLAVFSATNRYTIIDYVLTLNSIHVRKGQLVLSVNDTATTVAIADNYTYSPSLITDTGGAMITGFQFDATLKNNDGEAGNDTLLITYVNPNATGAVGTISYSVSYGV